MSEIKREIGERELWAERRTLSRLTVCKGSEDLKGMILVLFPFEIFGNNDAPPCLGSRQWSLPPLLPRLNGWRLVDQSYSSSPREDFSPFPRLESHPSAARCLGIFETSHTKHPTPLSLLVLLPLAHKADSLHLTLLLSHRAFGRKAGRLQHPGPNINGTYMSTTSQTYSSPRNFTFQPFPAGFQTGQAHKTAY
jgi:hypothetical protein